MNTPQKPQLHKHSVSISAISIHDLRVGSILNYDTGEGIAHTIIDWQDLKWLTENPTDFNKSHSPIKLDNEWLLKLGFEEVYNSDFTKRYDFIKDTRFDFLVNKQNESLSGFRFKGNTFYQEVKYVHQFQNFYHSIIGVMPSLAEC